MRIHEIIESDMVEMRLRKLARQLRYNQISFPNFYKYFYQSQRGDEFIKLPAKGLWVGKQTLRVPHKIMDDIAIGIYVSRSKVRVDWTMTIRLSMPTNPEYYYFDKLKKSTIAFVKEFIKKEIGIRTPLNPKISAANHYSNYIELRITCLDMVDELESLLAQHNDLLVDLIKYDKLNEFSALLRNIPQ